MNASSALLTKVEHLLREAFNPITGDGDRFRIGSDPNADALRRRLRLANLITQNLDRLGLPLHIDPDAAFFCDPKDLVLLDDVSMSLERRGALFAEQYTNFRAGPNLRSVTRGRLSDGVRDRAHTAAHIAPNTPDTIALTHHMME